MSTSSARLLIGLPKTWTIDGSDDPIVLTGPQGEESLIVVVTVDLDVPPDVHDAEFKRLVDWGPNLVQSLLDDANAIVDALGRDPAVPEASVVGEGHSPDGQKYLAAAILVAPPSILVITFRTTVLDAPKLDFLALLRSVRLDRPLN